MNGLTKQRYISTSIWSDDWFDSLSEREKLVYFYLLTNEHTNLAGVYQCTLKNVRLEIGLDRNEIERIMSKFAAAGKAFYYKDYIIIPKWLKHQKIKERSGLFLGASKVLKSLPDEIKAFISDRHHYDYDISEIMGDLPKTSPRPPLDLPPKNDTPLIEFPEIGGRPPQKKGGTSPRPPLVPPPQSTAKTAHDSDSDSDSDSDLDLDIDSDADLDSDPKQGGSQLVENSGKNQPAAKIINIQNTAKTLGFFISSKQAQAFHCLDTSWLTGDFNFIEYAAKRIREDYYGKSQSEQERIFSKAWNYDDMLQEYPSWKKKKIKQAAFDKKQDEIEQARENVPKTCPKCGSQIINKGCASCNGILVFDEKTLLYSLDIYPSTSLSEDLRRLNREKYAQENKGDGQTTVDIDF